MPQIRIFNPSFTPRAFFSGQRQKGGVAVAHKKHHSYRKHHRRHNPLGVNANVVKDAAYGSAGALASLWLSSMLPSFNTGWMGVGLTGAAAVAASMGARALGGGPMGDEVLKGGLIATIIRAVHQAGMLSSITMSGYVRSMFSVPTASDAYGRVTSSPYPIPVQAKTGAGVSGLGVRRFASRWR